MAENILGVLGSGLDDYGDSPIPGSRRDKLLRLAQQLKEVDLNQAKKVEYKPQIETPSAPTTEQQTAALQAQQNWKKERDSYDFLALGNIGGKGSPLEPSPALQGGIGNVRYIGDPFDSRRNTPVPQAQNIPGLPDRPLSSPWPMQTPAIKGEQSQKKVIEEQPRIERLTKGYEQPRKLTSGNNNSGQLQESNLAKVLKGEINTGLMKDPALLDSRFENIRKESEGGTYQSRASKPPKEIPGDIITQKGGGQEGRRTNIGRIPYAKNADGPAYDLIYGDYVGGFKRNAGELDDLQKSIYQKTKEQLNNPSNDPVDPSTVSIQKKQGDIGPAYTLDVVERGADKQLSNEGSVDPSRIVEQRTVNPDATASFLRDKEITAGKMAQELKNEYKTRVIGGTALENLRRKDGFNRFTSAGDLSKEQLIKAGINPSKMGSFAGILRSSGLDPRAVVKSNAQLQPSDEMGVSAAGLRTRHHGIQEENIYKAIDTQTGEHIQTDRTIPVGKNNSDVIKENLYRVGRPTAIDVDSVREELSKIDGSSIAGREKRGVFGSKATTRITAEQLESAIAKGQIGVVGQDEGSLVIARKNGTQTRLIPSEGGYIVRDAFETYATGPAPTLTQRGDASTETKIGGIRIAAENRKSGFNPKLRRAVQGYSNAMPFNKYIDELAKGALTQQPTEGTQQGLKELANIILNGPELGVSNEQVKLIFNDFAERHPEGSNARKLLNEALFEQNLRESGAIEKGGEVYMTRQPREVDLFSEEAIRPDADYGKSSTAEIQEIFNDSPIEKPYDESTNGGSDNGEHKKEVYNGNGYGVKGDDYSLGTRFGEEGRNPIGAGNPKWRGTNVAKGYITDTGETVFPRFNDQRIGRGISAQNRSLADEIRAKYLPPSNALNAPPSSNGEIPYKDYRAVANLTGAELGSDHQNRAMAIQAQRIAKLRRGF